MVIHFDYFKHERTLIKNLIHHLIYLSFVYNTNNYIIYCIWLFWKVLVTKPDFYNDISRKNLCSTLTELMKLNIVPILNANDVVAPPPEVDKDLAGVCIHVHRHQLTGLLAWHEGWSWSPHSISFFLPFHELQLSDDTEKVFSTHINTYTQMQFTFLTYVCTKINYTN